MGSSFSNPPPLLACPASGLNRSAFEPFIYFIQPRYQSLYYTIKSKISPGPSDHLVPKSQDRDISRPSEDPPKICQDPLKFLSSSLSYFCQMTTCPQREAHFPIRRHPWCARCRDSTDLSSNRTFLLSRPDIKAFIINSNQRYPQGPPTILCPNSQDRDYSRPSQDPSRLSLKLLKFLIVRLSNDDNSAAGSSFSNPLPPLVCPASGLNRSAFETFISFIKPRYQSLCYKMQSKISPGPSYHLVPKSQDRDFSRPPQDLLMTTCLQREASCSIRRHFWCVRRWDSTDLPSNL